MELSPEQIKEIKKQIINQINSAFPEDKKAESISKVESMNEEEIVQFLEQNNLIKNSEGNDASSENCIFCSIVSEEIPSTKIAENNDAIAILEINPVSEGHTIIIPKIHEENVSKDSEKLAKEIKEKIIDSLSPKDVLIEHSNLAGHAIINVIPVYGNSVETKRKKASVEELKKIKEKIISYKKIKEPIEEKNEKIREEILRVPKRIP
jgi:diadenosine tetraphosphate (Ap4A) HIT family hydrolase